MNLGDLQLGDGERSWPQRRRGGSDNYERAGGVPLTLSDFNLDRLSGVPRAQHVANYTPHHLPSASEGRGVHSTHTSSGCTKNILPSHSHTLTPVTHALLRTHSAEPMGAQAKINRRPPALELPPISSPPAPPIANHSRCPPRCPATPSNWAFETREGHDSTASSKRAQGQGPGARNAQQKLTSWDFGGNVYDVGPASWDSGDSASWDSQAETPYRRTRVTYHVRRASSYTAHASTASARESARIYYVKHVAVLESRHHGFSLVTESARYSSVKEFVADVKRRELVELSTPLHVVVSDGQTRLDQLGSHDTEGREKAHTYSKIGPRDITSTDITSTDVTSRDITSTDIASTDVTSTDITSTDIASRDITSTDIASRDIASLELQDSQLPPDSNKSDYLHGPAELDTYINTEECDSYYSHTANVEVQDT